MIAGTPDQGGASWSILQYVLGFRRLGYEVVLVEPVEELTTRSAAYLQSLVTRFGFEAALLRRGSRETSGISYRAPWRQHGVPTCSSTCPGCCPSLSCWSRSPTGSTSTWIPPSTSYGTRGAGSTCTSTATPTSSRWDRRSASLVARCRRVAAIGWPPCHRWCSSSGRSLRPAAGGRLRPSATGAGMARSSMGASATARRRTRSGP